MKIAVCVKAVPDAAAGQADRPGDQAARPLGRPRALGLRPAPGRGGAPAARGRRRGRGGRRLARAGRSAPTRCARRSRWAPTAPCSSPTRPSPGADLVATAHALAGALEREEADLVLFGQQSADGDGACLWAAVAELLRRPGDLAGRGAHRRGGRGDGQAPDRVRLRADPRAAAGGGRRLRCDQRAALPVAQGDHGREEQAAGGARRPPTSAASGASRTTRARRSRPPPSRGDRRRVEDGDGSPEAIVEFLVERRLLCEDARLPRAPRRRDHEAVARRARRRRPRSAARSPG